MSSRSRPAPFLSICALARITMPGMQKPHCSPPHAANASANAVPLGVVDALEGDDLLAGHLGQRLLAADDRLAVDVHRAAPALTARRAAVLGRGQVELVAERRQQMWMIGSHRDRHAVDREGHAARSRHRRGCRVGSRRCGEIGHALHFVKDRARSVTGT